MATCPVCTESWLLALELERDSPPVADRETTRRWRQLARIAAVVIVGVGLGFLIRGDRSEDTVLRTPEAQVLALLSDEVMASRGSCRLVWTAIEGARYDVRVTLEDLEEVSRALGLELAEFRVPEADLAAVPACTPLLAHIEAYRLGAGRLAGITARFRCDSPGSDC